MPLILPGQTLQPIPTTFEQQLLENRVTDFRFDLLERRWTTNGVPINESVVDQLQGVLGGEVSWTYNASVKGGGSLEVVEVGQNINWVTARIRPVAILNNETEVPIGVFVAAAPKKDHSAVGVQRPIEILDKCSLLDRDIYADLDTGQALPFSLAEGSDVFLTVKNLIERIGESAQMIPTDLGIVTANPMTWEVGTTLLKIINDLLSAAGYFSLWVDGMGQFQVTKYAPPASRPAIYELLAPFENGNLMAPDWSEDEDIYSIPNRFVATTTGDEENEGLISTAMLDPSSPYSYFNRGKQWVTAVEEGVEAVNQQSLDNYASWRLALAVSVSARREVSHPFLPEMQVNSNIFFREESRNRILCSIYKTNVIFDPLELSTTELAAVTEVIEDPEMDEPVDPPEDDFDEEDY